MKRTVLLLLLVAIGFGLVLVMSSCGPKESTEPQEEPSESVESQEQTDESPVTPPTDLPMASEQTDVQADIDDQPPSVAQSPETETVDKEHEDLAGIASLSGSAQSLKSLDSYRYTTIMEYEGTDDSETESERTIISGEYSAPDSYHLTIDNSSEEQSSEFVKIGQSLWVYDDGSWTEVPENMASSVAQSVFSLALDFMWASLASGLASETQYIGEERINGVLTSHYSSTSSYWQQLVGESVGEAQGEIWIAKEGYPVKFEFDASGTDEDGNMASVKWSGEVTDINAPVNISPPNID